MHCSLIVKFPGFKIIVIGDQIYCDGGSNIKTVKTKESSRCILDEMHASLLYLKVISYVTFIFV